MLNVGSHLTISNGFYKAGLVAVSMNANTFQFFTRNPRGGNAKELDPKDIENLRLLGLKNNFAPLFAHASYTMNLCSDKEDIRTFALDVLRDDIKRVSEIQNSYYIFHPGSHVKQGVETGINYIVSALNEAVDDNTNIKILLETMSGKGTEVGGTFEELKQIIDGVKCNKNIGVLLDTCHVYSAGYDIVNNLDSVLETFDKIIGLDRLYGIHLNDSMTPFGSKKDRHEKLGEGTIGIGALSKIINHEKLKHLPFNIETPLETEGHKQEISLLKSLYKG